MDVFLKESYKYRLGEMTTEKPHPKTQNLSELAKDNLTAALDILKTVDLDALETLRIYCESIEKLRASVQDTLKNGGRIFLCGCGATGRLSILNEFLWREKYPESDQVFSLMAGGDVALVHSLEGFEDFPEYGRRHLIQMGFDENDLLISCTEGGETPYVIGATEAATEISQRKPYFLYCNPDDLLKEKVERSKNVIENPFIEKICLFVGPMALSGSTRMQASTVLQLAVGMALLEETKAIQEVLDGFIKLVRQTDYNLLKPFIEKEAQTYLDGEYVMYLPYDYAISVFTDTTERSPTFSLPPFENRNFIGERPSLCYVSIPKSKNSDEAWQKLLNHSPRPLNWQDISHQTLDNYLKSFEFGPEAVANRKRTLNGKKQKNFIIESGNGNILWDFDGTKESFNTNQLQSLYQHTLLKLLLNSHSTLLMGRLNRYKSNIMTWVTPTNGKLIDRSARYVQSLLKEKNIEKTYEEVVKKIFENKETRKQDESIVLKTLESFLKEP